MRLTVALRSGGLKESPHRSLHTSYNRHRAREQERARSRERELVDHVFLTWNCHTAVTAATTTEETLFTEQLDLTYIIRHVSAHMLIFRTGDGCLP